MRQITTIFITTCICCFFVLSANAQQIRGYVLDSLSGDTLSFSSITIASTSETSYAKLDGSFKVENIDKGDTLKIGCYGFKSKKIPYKGQEFINVYLSPEDVVLDEVTINAGENPAFKIIRKAVEHRDQNNYALLSAYAFEAYNRAEVDMSNISENFREKKLLRKIESDIKEKDLFMKDDSTGEEYLPMFISETLSDFYYRADPEMNKEKVKASKVKGVGISDEAFWAQFIGASYQQYNFYDNSILVLKKAFISPISSGWKQSYKYELEDSMYVGEDWCYKINVKPKRAQDLAFHGTIWITSEDYALKEVDLNITEEANLNFVEHIHIQRTFKKTDGAWVPEETWLEADISELSDKWAGLEVKSYTSNRDIVINEPKPVSFYKYGVDVAEDATSNEEDFWEKHRHGELSERDLQSFAIVDSLNGVKSIATYVDVFQSIVNGYRKVGKVSLGSYLFVYAWNNVEGHRIRPGFKTNIDFSDKVELKGYVAYGTRDQRWKYSLQARYIPSKRPWNEVGFLSYYDVNQLGITGDLGSNLFEAFTHWGTLTGPFMNQKQSVFLKSELNRHITQNVMFNYRHFTPLFDFEYVKDRTSDVRESTITTSEVVFHTHLNVDETFIINDNAHPSMGLGKWPVLDLTYTLGMEGLMGSDFDYHRMDAQLRQKINMGIGGYSEYSMKVGKVFSTVPYPLLQVHLGNQSPFYTSFAFNMMDYFEFVSDQYASLKYSHHFNGFIMNRVPLLKKLKWRLVTNANILFGAVSDDNINVIPASFQSFRSLENEPFAEVGYGIENIFRIFRVQLFHRLTQLDAPKARSIGVKVAAQFSF